jgi:hypothetical protein
LARYVASGGGLILAGNAASNDAFALLRVGTTGRVKSAPMTQSGKGTTLRSLPLAPLVGLPRDAVVLERRDEDVAVAARRHVAGRVLQIGYVDSWRWRMSGGETSVADHRAWWTHAVASVAYATRISNPLATDSALDGAPFAKLIASLGQPVAHLTVIGAPLSASISAKWLLALLAMCLLAEWTSRRLRGAR